MSKFEQPKVPGSTLKSMETWAIKETLAACNGRLEEAADILGVGIRTLQMRLQQWRQTREDYKGENPPAASSWEGTVLTLVPPLGEGEYEGASEEIAVRHAAEARGVPPGAIVYEVLNEGTAGVFGLGARPWRIRVVKESVV